MSEKLFIISIPMLPTESLKKISYRKEDRGEIYSEPSRFPGIVMLENCILDNDTVKIVTVRTDDDNGRTEGNYALFKEELGELSERLNKALKVDKEIVVTHSENRDKQLQLFKELCSCFNENDEVYMDITYGTKVTSACMFSTLSYAEKVVNCDIKGVYYGKYSHGSTEHGDLYDVRCLYELAMLSNAADFMNKEQFDGLIKELWG